MIIAPYKPDDLKRILVQPAQAMMRPLIGSDEYCRYLGESGPAFSAFRDDTVVACGGLIPLWQGRSHAWAVLSDNIRHDFIRIHRAAERLFRMSGVRRIEATVQCDFQKGHDWLLMLGFTCEAKCMRGYLPDGGDAALYARVQSCG